MKIKSLFYLLVLVLQGCNVEPQSEINEKFRQEKESRQLKRVTEGQLSEFTFAYARKLADTINLIRDQQLLQQVLAKFKINKINREDINLIKDIKTKEIFEAYEYNVEKNLSMGDNLQKISGDTFLFTRPTIQNTSFSGIIAIKLARKEMIKQYSEKEPVIKLK